MLALVLLAIQCHGLVEDSRFKVIKCSTDDGQPELTFTIDKEYFEQNLLWQADQEYFKVMIRIFRTREQLSVGQTIVLSVEQSQFKIILSLRW